MVKGKRIGYCPIAKAKCLAIGEKIKMGHKRNIHKVTIEVILNRSSISYRDGTSAPKKYCQFDEDTSLLRQILF